MCYLAHAPAVARVLAGLVEIMGRAVRAAEALRGLQRRRLARGAHRETQIAQEAVRESRVRRHALVVDAADLRPHARLAPLRDGSDGGDDCAKILRLGLRQRQAGLRPVDDEDALSVQEVVLSTDRRLGASEEDLLRVQNNLATAYFALGRSEQALQLKRDVYSGKLKLYGEEHESTLRAANNYANSLLDLERFEEAKALLRRTIPVTRRVLGDSSRTTLAQRCNYAESLYEDPEATLDDLREAVTTLEEVERIARRVLGGAHPLTVDIELELRDARAALRAREESASGDVSALCEALEAMPPGDAN